MHHIVFPDRQSLAPSVELPRLPFAHRWTEYDFSTPEELVARLQDATIVMTCNVPLRAEQLRRLPHLQMISLALTGTDLVDLDYCDAHGIVVTNVPGYAANTVAEHVVAMIFDLFRQVPNYHRLMQRLQRREIAPRGAYADYRVRDVAGKTLGIIGRGAIAMRLAEIARALGMKLRFYDRGGRLSGPEFLPLPALLAESDVLSIHVPLTPETRNLIGADELRLMKHDAILINTARGGIVDEAALIDALRRGRIGGAALDVLAHEPVSPDDPILALLDHPNFILTPHVAWSSEEAMQRVIDQAIANISDFAQGRRPAHVVCRENIHSPRSFSLR